MDTWKLMKKGRKIYNPHARSVDGRISTINIPIHIINFPSNGSFPSSLCRCCRFVCLKGGAVAMRATAILSTVTKVCCGLWVIAIMGSENFKWQAQACNLSRSWSALLSKKYRNSFLHFFFQFFYSQNGLAKTISVFEMCVVLVVIIFHIIILHPIVNTFRASFFHSFSSLV